jgi:hypothetical protein
MRDVRELDGDGDEATELLSHATAVHPLGAVHSRTNRKEIEACFCIFDGEMTENSL